MRKLPRFTDEEINRMFPVAKRQPEAWILITAVGICTLIIVVALGGAS